MIFVSHFGEHDTVPRTGVTVVVVVIVNDAESISIRSAGKLCRKRCPAGRVGFRSRIPVAGRPTTGRGAASITTAASLSDSNSSRSLYPCFSLSLSASRYLEEK